MSRTCFEGPFGEVIRATGPMAKANPFRFSTKYQDAETDLVYYGYRYYNAATGRWLSRDPLKEQGGLNLYAFGRNDSINNFDSNGEELGEALFAMVVDVGVQVSINLVTGNDWYDISASSVVVAGLWGLAGNPGIEDLGKVAKLLSKSGRAAVRAEKTASKIPLKSTAANIARLNARLARQTAEAAKAEAEAGKVMLLITAGEVTKKAVDEITESLARYAENGVVTMGGCPNPGYGMSTKVNIVEQVVIPLSSLNSPPPIIPPPE